MKGEICTVILVTGIICLLVMAAPVAAVKTAEQSAGDSIARGSRFTVSITGLPNTSYYIWIPHTATMTGKPYDQPPYITGSQVNVRQDPAEGPWAIGSYQYANGNGRTIQDDIVPSTPDTPNTRYYALVTTDADGLATVEFRTSVYTGLRSYSVRVENPDSAGSDTLYVSLQLHPRGASGTLQIDTTPETRTPEITTTVLRTLPPATTERTLMTMPSPVQNATPPAPVPAVQRSPVAAGALALAAGAVFLILRRQE